MVVLKAKGCQFFVVNRSHQVKSIVEVKNGFLMLVLEKTEVSKLGIRVVKIRYPAPKTFAQPLFGVTLKIDIV